MFEQYVEHGWSICRIQPGQKGPRTVGWNLKENAITNPARAQHLVSAGLCHAYSGTCALDIDRFDEAAAFLQEHGIDLNVLFNAPDAVRISSGTANRGKLIYKLATPLPSKMLANGAFELRCASSSGRTVQDVLPPSVHTSGRLYEWVGDWKQLPTIPSNLLQFWQSQVIVEKPKAAERTCPADLDELHRLLLSKNPNCSYEEWLKIGMVLHHETDGHEEGFILWDQWSAQSELKYPGTDVLAAKWNSFGSSNTPVTADFLRKTDVSQADEFSEIKTTDASDDTLGLFEEKPKKKEVRFRVLTTDELIARPEPEWIIPDVLPQCELGCMWGKPGSGKTFVALDVALSVATGTPWRGVDVKQGYVLYIAAEDDQGVQIRLQAALADRGLPRANIGTIPGRPVPIFHNKEHMEEIYQIVTGLPERPLIIFVDTLARVTPGMDENSGKDMGRVMHFCGELHVATGALVDLIHHAGKTEGMGPRGWSGMNGAFGVEWEVVRDEQRRYVDLSKMKNEEDKQQFEFQLTRTIKSCVVDWLL